MAHMGAIFSRFAFICDECESSYVYVCVYGMHLVFALWIFLFWHFLVVPLCPARAIFGIWYLTMERASFFIALVHSPCVWIWTWKFPVTHSFIVCYFSLHQIITAHTYEPFFSSISTLLTFFTSKFVYRISSYKLETENFFFYALPANEICLRFHPIVLVSIVYCMCLCSRDVTGFFSVRQTKQIFPFRRSTSINYRENVENSNRKDNFLITTSISSKLFCQRQRQIVSIFVHIIGHQLH